tara:strand:- start:110 stop:268 length:159 start_codon:yes stop_codon:yes gene_type:complete
MAEEKKMDESDDKINNLIDKWHDDEDIIEPLHEYLNMTWEEYSNWATKGLRK